MVRWKLLTVSMACALASSLLVAAPAEAAEAQWWLHNANAGGGVEYFFGWGNTDECNAIVGDWDGNGTDTPGAVCAKPNGEWQWSLHNANAGGGVEYFFGWGSTSCLPTVGDWDGNGTATPGLVCANGAEWQWSLHNYNAGGGVEYQFGWGGTAGCWPIAGDWDGNRTRTPGLVCPVNGAWRWVMHNYNAGGGVEYQFDWGGTACPPIWGDWDGNGSETPGTLCSKSNGEYQWGLHNYNQAGAVEYNFGWGGTNRRAVIGDWDGNGTMTPGLTSLGTTPGGGGTPTGYSLPLPRSAAPRGEYDDPHHDYPAIDIGVPTGTPALAVVSGTVARFSNSACGNGMELTSNSLGAQFVYCHLSGYSVASGASVSAGQQIALTGATGNATGPHLHFELEVNNVNRCPQTWLLAIYDGRTPPAPGSLPTTGCIS